jgi:hypothetical protein
MGQTAGKLPLAERLGIRIAAHLACMTQDVYLPIAFDLDDDEVTKPSAEAVNV